MVRMRPVWGSTTTTVPSKGPSASTAARRTSRSSPSTLSPWVGSKCGKGRKRVLATGCAGARAGTALGLGVGVLWAAVVTEAAGLRFFFLVLVFLVSVVRTHSV